MAALTLGDILALPAYQKWDDVSIWLNDFICIDADKDHLTQVVGTVEDQQGYPFRFLISPLDTIALADTKPPNDLDWLRACLENLFHHQAARTVSILPSPREDAECYGWYWNLGARMSGLAGTHDACAACDLIAQRLCNFRAANAGAPQAAAEPLRAQQADPHHRARLRRRAIRAVKR